MSRSGYVDDIEDQWAYIRWRGAVKSAMRGERGQKLLREAAAALDAMPVKELAKNDLQAPDGSYCALGAVGAARGLDMSSIDPENYEAVAAAFGISDAMAREIVFMNDEAAWRSETPAERWKRMRDWIDGWIKKTEDQP